jgi:uncharacterized protein YcsI (UPF0317 family)
MSPDPASNPGLAARLRARRSEHHGTTSGLAPGYVQANLVVLPTDYADEFREFCARNAAACPVLAISRPGDPRLPELGCDLDVRTDLPAYRVLCDGALAAEVTDIASLWRADLVAFALGCSFSSDHVLAAAGVTLRYLANGGAAPAYLTSLPATPAGRFHGPLAVSMRPLTASDAIRAIQISARYPGAHGAPIHLGASHLIGITDINRPEFGAPPDIRDDELPVFWACGVTPQAAVAASRIPFCITHGPSTMLVTDLRVADTATG